MMMMMMMLGGYCSCLHASCNIVTLLPGYQPSPLADKLAAIERVHTQCMPAVQ